MGGEPEGDPEVLQEIRLVVFLSVCVSCSFTSQPIPPFLRARSIYERALDVDHRNITLWLKYAEMEMKSRQVNHARNIWDRAITILPRVNQFWYEWLPV